jgi:hypothetical protein
MSNTSPGNALNAEPRSTATATLWKVALTPLLAVTPAGIKAVMGVAEMIHAHRPDQGVSPRPTRDPARDFAKFGPLQPMQRPSLLARIFGGK